MPNMQMKAVKLFKYILLGIGVILIIIPMYITIITALKTPAASAKDFFAPPTSFYIGNFMEVMRRANYFVFIRNSITVTLFGSIFIAIIIPMTSYAIARNMARSRYYRFLYFYIIIGIFTPFQVIMIPLTRLMNQLGLMNIRGLILICITFSLTQGTFLTTAYINTVPKDLEESAQIDGAGPITIFLQVVYPLITPIVATFGIIRALWMWNDFLLPLLILNKSQRFWTLPLFQYNFKTQYGFDYNLAFSSFLLAILPIMVLYVFIQRYIIAGLTAGALKG